MSNNAPQTIEHLNHLLRAVSRKLIERESLVQLIVLSMIAQEHLLVLGPPGTAKSAAVRAVSKAFECQYFEYLLGRFSEPSELFGPVDLRKLKEGVVEIETSGMLPQADIAFLDEIFLGSTAILNTLLGILNERRFKRGKTDLLCPLRICVAASNSLPEEPGLAAIADRFLVRIYVESLPDSALEDLLEAGWKGVSNDTPALPAMSLKDIDTLSQMARQVDMSIVRPILSHCIRLLRKAGIELSDRRLVKSQSLIAASAVLNGASVATQADLWPLIYIIPTPQAQQQAREVLQEILQHSANPVLPHAVSNAAASIQARAQIIISDIEQLLAQPPENELLAQQNWRLKCEALLREIDAGFSAEQLPEPLVALRLRLVALVQPDEAEAVVV